MSDPKAGGKKSPSSKSKAGASKASSSKATASKATASKASSTEAAAAKASTSEATAAKAAAAKATAPKASQTPADHRHHRTHQEESDPVVTDAASTTTPGHVVTQKLPDATAAEAAAPVVAAIEHTSERSRFPRFALIMVSVAGVAISLWLLRSFASIIAPVFLGLNLMITVQPLTRILRRRGLPSWAGAIISLIVVLLVLVAFALGVTWSVVAMVQELPNYSQPLQNTLNNLVDWLGRLGVTQDTLLDQLKGIDPQSVINLATSLLGSLQSFGTLFIVMVTAIVFMAMDSPSMESRIDLARGTHPRFVDALTNFSAGIRRYWIVSTVFGLIVAVLDGIALLLLGVPLALVWALFSFLTNYIPNIGFVIGLIPPALLALLANGPQSALIVVILYSVLNFVVQSIIQPKFAGDAVGLTPTMSFLSLMLWTVILGGMGALLALPASLFMKSMLVDADPRARWVNALISSRPADAIEVIDVD